MIVLLEFYLGEKWLEVFGWPAPRKLQAPQAMFSVRSSEYLGTSKWRVFITDNDPRGYPAREARVHLPRFTSYVGGWILNFASVFLGFASALALIALLF